MDYYYSYAKVLIFIESKAFVYRFAHNLSIFCLKTSIYTQ